jgi:nicotinate-nucleotide adenylyltransferase
MREKFHKHEFALIMGSDNLLTLDRWKNFEEILKHCDIYVYPRKSSESGALKNHRRVKITDAPGIGISSSMIRESIRNKKDVRFFLPEAVWKYITRMKFYRD